MANDIIIVCSAQKAEHKIQPYLEKGWVVKHCVAENVSISTATTGGRDYRTESTNGDFVFILHWTGV